MRLLIPILCSLFIQGCGESEPVSKIVHVTKYSTIGLGPEEYRDEIVEKLQNIGIPIIVGIPDDMGIADISWSKDYDEQAYTIIKPAQKISIPEDGGILNVAYCKTDSTIQSWQTSIGTWLIQVEPGKLSGELISGEQEKNVFSSLFEIPKALQICSTIEQKFTLVLPIPLDIVEANKRLGILEVDGRIESENKYYYWVK